MLTVQVLASFTLGGEDMRTCRPGDLLELEDEQAQLLIDKRLAAAVEIPAPEPTWTEVPNGQSENVGEGKPSRRTNSRAKGNETGPSPVPAPNTEQG